MEIDTTKYGKIVPPTGPKNAKIVIIGEAPGATEVELGRPFCGKSGDILDKLCEASGIKRDETYITNVCKVRPPNNEFKWFRKKEQKKFLQESIEELQREVREVSPNVIICVGAEAQAAITGDRRISARRGFVDLGLLGIKTISTYHPAAILRDINLYPIALFDFKRAMRESKEREWKKEEIEIILGTDFQKTMDCLDLLLKEPIVSFDIENVSEGIDSIGLGWNPKKPKAISIPFLTPTGSFWSLEQEQKIWSKIKELLESTSVKKVAQNAFYDMWHLQTQLGIHVKNVSHDTMLAAGLINSEFPKNLWFLASMYTTHPFWEDEGGDKLNEERWRYNATDAAITLEIADKQSRELDEYGYRGFYDKLTMPLLPYLVRTSVKGVRFDTERRDQLLKETTRTIRESVKQLLEITGEGFNYRSYPQLCKYFIEGKGIQPVVDHETKRPSFADEAMETLSRKYPELKEFGLINGIRKLENKVKVLETPVGADGRIRCSYNISGTETGRLSSSEAPDRTGTNLQNIMPELRKLFLADLGCYIVKADLKQAENIMVAYMSGDPFMIQAIEEGGDLHAKIASMIFKKPVDQITKKERQLGKKIGHASNYGMRPKRLQEVAWEEEQIVITRTEAKALMEQYFNAFPRIKVWHTSIQGELSRGRVLSNPFGRTRKFLGYWGDDLFREAYAFLPQGAIADRVAESIIQLYEQVDIRLQVHDEIVFNVPEGSLQTTCQLIKQTMEAPFMINNRKVSIPVEIKYGRNWGETQELKL